MSSESILGESVLEMSVLLQATSFFLVTNSETSIKHRKNNQKTVAS